MKQARQKYIKRIGYLFLLTILVFLPLFNIGAYLIYVGIMLYTAIVLAVSLRLIFSVGRISFGHGAFMAIGAYTSIMLTLKLGWSFWLTWPLGILATAIVAIFFGFATLAARGMFFSIVTFCFAAGLWSFIGGQEFLYGWHGWSFSPPNSISIAGRTLIDFTSKVPYYYIALGLMLLCIVIIYRLEKSHIGKVFGSIRQNPDLAESIGINTARYEVLAFTIGCAFAGAVGSFQAQYNSFIGPNMFDLFKSIQVFIYVVVGGMGSIAGAGLGGAFLVILSEVSRPLAMFQYVVYAIILLLVILFLPTGLLGLPKLVSKLFTKLHTKIKKVKPRSGLGC